MGHNDEARREMVVYKANEGSQNKIARRQSMENNQQNYQDLIYKAQMLVEKDKNNISFEQVVEFDMQVRHLDIWEDPLSKKLFISELLGQDEYDPINIERATKRVMRYHWHEDIPYF